MEKNIEKYSRFRIAGVSYNGFTFNFEFNSLTPQKRLAKIHWPAQSRELLCRANMAFIMGYDYETKSWDLLSEKMRYGADWFDGYSNAEELSAAIQEHSLAPRLMQMGVEDEINKKAEQAIGNYFG